MSTGRLFFSYWDMTTWLGQVHLCFPQTYMPVPDLLAGDEIGITTRKKQISMFTYKADPMEKKNTVFHRNDLGLIYIV